MGNPIQKLNGIVSLVASERTWIEGLAIQQLSKTAELDRMHAVAGMPDLRPGKRYAIGTAFFSLEKIYPTLVGNDIGCGMGLWQTSLKTNKVNLDILAKRLRNVESPLDESWQEYIFERKLDKQIANDAFDLSLGTIGGGNHFADFQQVVDVQNPDKLGRLGMDPKQIQLLVHSGSRGLG